MDFSFLRIALPGVVVLVTMTLSAWGQNREPDYQALLKRLQQLEEQRESRMAAAVRQQQNELKQLADSPFRAVSAYKKAYRYQNFAGKPSEDILYSEWEKKFGALHDEKLFKEAAGLHVEYLIMTLELVQSRNRKKKREQLMPSLVGYVERVERWDAAVGKVEKPKSVREQAYDKRSRDFDERQVTGENLRLLMSKNLAQSPFVKQYQLDDHVKQVKDWEANPGNLDGILDKAVLPALREAKDPRLMELWQTRLARKEAKARRGKNAAALDRFENVQKPQLLWKWSQDMIVLDRKGEAYTRMIRILEDYPEHAKFEEWSRELAEMLKAETGGDQKSPPEPEPEPES